MKVISVRSWETCTKSIKGWYDMFNDQKGVDTGWKNQKTLKLIQSTVMCVQADPQYS